jgi:hypothetical protein
MSVILISLFREASIVLLLFLLATMPGARSPDSGCDALLKSTPASSPESKKKFNSLYRRLVS